MKIQINSLEALERLIGGDTTLEIEIRNSVVQNFVNKHLKALANEQIIGNAERNVKALVNDLMLEKVGTGYSSTTQLKGTVKEMITKQINNEVKTVIRDLVSKTVIESSTLESINILIQQQADLIIETLTDENLELRLNNMVNKKLKEKLGL